MNSGFGFIGRAQTRSPHEMENQLIGVGWMRGQARGPVPTGNGTGTQWVGGGMGWERTGGGADEKRTHIVLEYVSEGQCPAGDHIAAINGIARCERQNIVEAAIDRRGAVKRIDHDDHPRACA